NVTVMDEPVSNAAHPITFSRRAALKTLGAGLGPVAVSPCVSDQAAEAFALIQETNTPPALRLLNAAQYTAVYRIFDMLSPADDHAPVVRDARVAGCNDLLRSDYEAHTRREWTTGVAALDEESTRRFQPKFDPLAPAYGTALVTEISRNESAPSTIL